jgi:hypothetical protein
LKGALPRGVRLDDPHPLNDEATWHSCLSPTFVWRRFSAGVATEEASTVIGQADPDVKTITLRSGTGVGRLGPRAPADAGVERVAKHVANHTRRNFGKAIHGVFRSVDKVRPLVRQTLEEGVQLSEHFAKSSGLEMVERGGVRLTRQMSRTPGKVRWLLQKEFSAPIGTNGEKVLRVVIDMSGRLVTAFPADKLLITFGTIVAVDAFGDGIADAAENVQFEAERLIKLQEMERNKIDLWDFVPWIGQIWGGALNESEDLILAHDRWIDQVVRDVIKRAEWGARSSLANRPALEDIVRIGMGLPVLLEHDQ